MQQDFLEMPISIALPVLAMADSLKNFGQKLAFSGRRVGQKKVGMHWETKIADIPAHLVVWSLNLR